MPSTWTEPDVDASVTRVVAFAGRVRCVRIPDDWPPGREVRVLLLPAAHHNGATPRTPGATLKPTTSKTP